MKRIKLTVAYDGTNYCGWQLQKNGRTIEEVLNEALSKLFSERVAVIGASRTDSGVHSEGNAAVFDTESRMPADKICFAVNQWLPEDIRILKSEEVSPDYHPRKCNCVKTYEYRILNRRIELPTLRLYAYFCYYPLDAQKMRQAASYLVGEHNFKSFCTPRTQACDMVRTVYSLEVLKAGDLITLRISGSGFLYNMVRIIAGTLMRVGAGVYPPEHVKEILAARNRAAAGPTAVARGLTLLGLEEEIELKPLISGRNEYWEYILDQTRIVTEGKAALTIVRCVPEEFDDLLFRMVHQAVRNGAAAVYVEDREEAGQNGGEKAAGCRELAGKENGRLEPGRVYGYYVFEPLSGQRGWYVTHDDYFQSNGNSFSGEDE